MSKKKYFPAALLIIAVLLIAGLFVYSSGQNKDKEKKETETAVADQAEVESMWEEAVMRFIITAPPPPPGTGRKSRPSYSR